MSGHAVPHVMRSNTDGRLRTLQASDLEMVRAWRNQPDVRRWMYTQHAIKREEHQRWFEAAASNPNRHLLIFERSGMPSGFVNLTIVDSVARRAEWGFYLASDADKGSGPLLGKLALSYVFSNLEQHKLCGEAIAHNHRSVRFHERLGFHLEARLRDHYFDGSDYHDVVGFGLLAAEWLGDNAQ